MITTIWIIFSILTFYLTAKSYYYDCDKSLYLLDIMSENQAKGINIIMTVLISSLYGILGPIGLILIYTIMVSKKLSNFI